MMKLLVDTNVFYDYFARRHPFDREAALRLVGCAMRDFEVWISSSQVTDLYFLLTHGDERLSKEFASGTLQRLRRHVRVAALTEADVDDALAAQWNDFEDACIGSVARRIKATYVVTRNKKDFVRSPIPAVTPTEFLDLIAEQTGITYDQIQI